MHIRSLSSLSLLAHRTWRADTLLFARWKSDVSSYPSLDSQLEFGPAYSYEYSTRETYGKAISGWGLDDPLNGTWWHRVTEGAIQTSNPFTLVFNVLSLQPWRPILAWLRSVKGFLTLFRCS